jgi:hypothetical protein
MQALAEQLGMAKSTLENALQTRRAPSAPTHQRLTNWLGMLAPEVATPAVPFRGNGAEHAGTGNGSAADQTAPG